MEGGGSDLVSDKEIEKLLTNIELKAKQDSEKVTVCCKCAHARLYDVVKTKKMELAKMKRERLYMDILCILMILMFALVVFVSVKLESNDKGNTASYF